MTEQTITHMLGHFEASCNTALQLKQWGTITADEYARHLNSVIARMEYRVRSHYEELDE